MTYLNLGKLGDILSLCPILQHEYKTTGEKPVLLVAKEYAPLTERLPFVQSHIWNSDWQDLRGAILYAKQTFDEVVTPQIFGKDFPIAKRTPSFQLDQWLRAGYVDRWDTLSLEISRNGHVKTFKKPTILFADHSQSSPFSRKDELHRLLVDYFGTTHEIIRLSEVRVPNPLDLLPLFDAADCLVTVETMMLHLSAASRVPTVALIADSPTTWKGSAWSKRFLAHIRYSDFENRRDDIVRAVKDALNKSVKPKVEIFKTLHDFAYNPSIIKMGDKVLISYRHHPDPSSWRTELAIIANGAWWRLNVQKFEDHSLEDMRLFEHRDKLHGSFTIAKSGKEFSPCVTAYGELHFNGRSWSVQNMQIPKYEKNNFSGQEKNWSFWSREGKLYVTYQHSPEHIVLELEGSKVVKEWKSPSPACSYGVYRGGTQPMPFNGQLLRFCHALQRNDRSDQYWSYHLLAVLMEPQPPFTITKISSHPILSGTEQYFHGWPRFKPRVLIPYGAIKHGDGWRVSVGINDSACATVDLKPEHLNL